MSRPFSSSSSTLQTTRGPLRAPLPARTASPCESRRKTQIPVEKFLDVLQNSEYYAEMYPEVLPLTRKIYRQLRERIASGGASLKWPESRGPMMKTVQVGRRTTRDQLLNVQTMVEDFVASPSPEPVGGFQDSKHRQVRPCEYEGSKTSYLEMEMEEGSNGSATCIDSEGTNVMDIVERGQWSETQPLLSVSWLSETTKTIGGHYE